MRHNCRVYPIPKTFHRVRGLVTPVGLFPRFLAVPAMGLYQREVEFLGVVIRAI